MALARLLPPAARLGLILAATGVLYFALAPAEDAAGTGSSVLNHLIAFYVLSALLDFACPRTGFGIQKAAALLGFGLLIELLQAPLPDRHFSLLDVVVDACGIGLYALSRPLVRQLPGLRLLSERP